jgi:CRISPR-associated exonuclease Cas4
MQADEVGGVHIKYLIHCPRQLWLFAHGIRPEHLSEAVHYGEAVHQTRYTRYQEVDLGTDRIDHVDADGYVHEIKSSRAPSEADCAQAVHYCHRLAETGVSVPGAVLHYPAVRRTVRVPYDAEHQHQAVDDIDKVLTVVHSPTAPPRLVRTACKGCSYIDYCWSQ